MRRCGPPSRVAMAGSTAASLPRCGPPACSAGPPVRAAGRGPSGSSTFPTPDAASPRGLPRVQALPAGATGRAGGGQSPLRRAGARRDARPARRAAQPGGPGALLAASPSTLGRRFRAADGRTPMRALADLRAEFAETLLRDDRLTALEIGLSAGFGSPAAFARAFRRRTGRSPSAWRRAMRRPGREAAKPAPRGQPGPCGTGRSALVGSGFSKPRQHHPFVALASLGGRGGHVVLDDFEARCQQPADLRLRSRRRAALPLARPWERSRRAAIRPA